MTLDVVPRDNILMCCTYMLPVDYYSFMQTSSIIFTCTNTKETWQCLFVNYLVHEKQTLTCRSSRRRVLNNKIERLQRKTNHSFRYGLFLHLRNKRMLLVHAQMVDHVVKNNESIDIWCKKLRNILDCARAIPLSYHSNKKFCKYLINKNFSSSVLLQLCAITVRAIRFDEVHKSHHVQVFHSMLQELVRFRLQITSLHSIRTIFALAHDYWEIFSSLMKLLKQEVHRTSYSIENDIISGILTYHKTITSRAMIEMINVFGIDAMQQVIDGRLFIVLARHDAEWVKSVQQAGIKFKTNDLSQVELETLKNNFSVQL
jgi:hypothetical protein